MAFQLAQEYKREIYHLLREHPKAERDFRFADQLRSAASGVEACIAEGFHRQSKGELRQFVRYALGSLAESQFRLKDGVDRQHYTLAACDKSLRLGVRCRILTVRFFKSLSPSTR